MTTRWILWVCSIGLGSAFPLHTRQQTTNSNSHSAKIILSSLWCASCSLRLDGGSDGNGLESLSASSRPQLQQILIIIRRIIRRPRRHLRPVLMPPLGLRDADDAGDRARYPPRVCPRTTNRSQWIRWCPFNTPRRNSTRPRRRRRTYPHDQTRSDPIHTRRTRPTSIGKRRVGTTRTQRRSSTRFRSRARSCYDYFRRAQGRQ
ncbi:hypothetical protein V565_009320 [Rhizoctonia solani 123E]|uniref:Transmembrane protein n=1 Tax=Rhizoctonia solani 123E TaxID=1423351 RepID=A0A074SBQ5_9AGAM|nr:hypothetical protein V565_009320 [Rhizoctonia solani 123E]